MELVGVMQSYILGSDAELRTYVGASQVSLER